MLAGKPLLAYTIDAARASGVIDKLILSTESEHVMALGRRLGVEVPFRRPAKLAEDDTPMLPVILHAVREMEEREAKYDLVALLQPTAPLRRPEHIVQAVSILERTGCDAVVSVVESPKNFSPDMVMRLNEGRLSPFLPEAQSISRRQDATPAYSRDGTIYLVRRDVLMTERSLYGSDCRPLVLESGETLNLDDPEDWALAESLLGGEGSVGS
jgi:CMP-N,N'-diacetyllegionaminic acid synthase